MARCFEKVKTSLTIVGRNKVTDPLHRSVHGFKQRQYGLLQAIPSCIIPDVVNRTFGNRAQSLDWVRLKNSQKCSSSIMFDCRTNGTIGFVWVRLVYGSVRGLTKRQGNLLL